MCQSQNRRRRDCLFELFFLKNQTSFYQNKCNYNKTNLSQKFNPFYSTDLYLYPKKTSSFKMFSGGTKRDQWHEID